MPETRDPAIKLFGKTIALPVNDGGGSGEGEEDKGHPNKESAIASKNIEQVSPNSEDKSADDNHKQHSSVDQELELEAEMNSNTEEEQNESSNPQEKTLKKPDKILPCPRCNSLDTKFCYYNNYSRMQPRYLCRACKRHWTEGGTLRNVPVGGGRKNKRARTKSNEDPQQQQQQQQVAPALPFTAQLENDFTDTLRQLMCQQQQPQQQLPLPSLLPSDYSSREQVCAAPNAGNPFSISTPSQYEFYSTGQDLVGGDSSALYPSKYLQESPLQTQMSYWNFWDGITDLSTPELLTAQELGQTAENGADRN